ncbi:hypothetical protein Krac_11210 [Ktedonobacter racemifer DSM 44963]|uniref:Uncharacterized protein n=1 Tax=Ktedonobacter racemifer DSM 44963 TaxID=485913 RepID=D6TJN8_KTERA|nr:hypothetical protein Krac_11210 [Ktedonobacter racemifer DSM 44963]
MVPTNYLAIKWFVKRVQVFLEVGEGNGRIKKGKACLVWGYKQALDPGRNDLSKPVTHSGKT